MIRRFLPGSKKLIALLLFMIVMYESDGHAATPVFADSNLAYAGFTPCFATLQEAINNAGPAPAEVGIFPGIYAEGVDLSLMGSAIGELPGSILLQVLNAAGGATDNGVLIDPTGLAILLTGLLMMVCLSRRRVRLI